MSNPKRLVDLVLTLLAISLLVSMAAMSTLFYSIAVIMTILWLKKWILSDSPSGYWPRLGPDKALWLYWAIISLGAVLIPEIAGVKARWAVFTEGKWILYLYSLTAVIINFKADKKSLIHTLAFCAIPVSLYSIFQCFTGIDFIRTPNPNYLLTGTDLWRTRGFFSTPLTLAYSFAMLLSALLPFVLYRAVDLKKNIGRLFIVSLLLIATTIICTFVRGAWVALVCQVTLIFYMWKPKEALKLIALGAFTSLILMASVPSIRHRVSSIADFQSHSTAVRFKLWRSNWEMFKEHPLLGIGARRNSEIVETYNIKIFGEPVMATNAHNNIMQVLAGVGIFGFIFWLVSMYGLFKVTLNHFRLSTDPWYKSLHLGSLAAQFGFHIGGLTQATFVDSEVLLMYCFWVALSIAARRCELARGAPQV